MRALVIINPASGPAPRRDVGAREALAQSVLAAHGVDGTVAITTSRGHAHALAAEARQRAVPLVIAWGGDGTINEVGSALAGSAVHMAIVPGGSGNGLARDLGLPGEAADALAVAASGRVRSIDGGRVDEAWFFNVAGIGLDAAIADRLDDPHARRGLMGYIQAAAVELPAYRPRRYTADIDGRVAVIDCLFVALANSRQYGNGAVIAPAARLDDGRLDVVMVGRQSWWRLATRVPALFRGTLAPGPGLQMDTFRQLTLASDRPIQLHVDGEPQRAGTQLTVRAEPSVLRVVTP